jgi:pyridoxine 5-phosphate synthase
MEDYMTRLSVNINKIATIRNARGGNNPDLIQIAKDCEKFGAQGITVHPRPDERHIRYNDVLELKPVVTTEFNIEGYPNERYMELVKKIMPHQATLVPDPPGVLTSNAGWDTIENEKFLYEIIKELNDLGIRTSIFVDPQLKYIEGAKKCGTNRIELYTESYAAQYFDSRENAIKPFAECAMLAKELGLEINAGHDLDLNNLKFFKNSLCTLHEVSIGHAIICDALYLGLEKTIGFYLDQLK